MGVSSAMNWWDEWKLRILVLCSLFVQFFLYFSEIVRMWYILRWLRVLVWIAYIGGDALAIYALATLFNRQKLQATMAGGGGNDAIEVIWAPVLLIHLGGQSISAYSLEDNELWKRHAITLVSQVTVALYVFCKWWSGETRLLQAAVLLFIVGILRFGEKPWALRRASFRTLQASTNLSPARKTVWSALCFTSFLDIGQGKKGGEEGNKNQICSLEDYVKEARKHIVKGTGAARSGGGGEAQAQEQESKKNATGVVFPDTKYIYNMFLDLSAPYSTRLHYLELFLNLDDKKRHEKLREWIQAQFMIMYTKVRSASTTCFGCCLSCLLPMLALASLILFAKSDKDGYDKSDIMVTYILFSGMVVIEFTPLWHTIIATQPKDQVLVTHSWQDMVPQHNTMLFCARRKKPITVVKLAGGGGYLRDFINKHLCIWHEPAAQQISVLVRRHAEDGWKEYVHDAPTYRRFNNFRGDRTLKKHNLLGQEQLGWSMNLPFDECVLLWHIATDLCLHHTISSSSNNTTTASSSQSSEDTIESRRSSSEIISNYMVYLLFICPEMLMLGTRQDLFMLACDDIKPMIKGESLDERSAIAQHILSLGQAGDQLVNKAPRISDACKLANKLLIDHNQEERWKVIQGVWVEMLCYSASRCRGYEHAKSLSHGGEYLTNVWLLWSCMGMETLPDKIHNPGPPEPDPAEKQDAAAALV